MDIESSSWSESAAANTATPPDAFRGGMAAGMENNTFREVMAAVKREWNRSHPTKTLTAFSSSVAQTVDLWLTPDTSISGYVTGQIYGAFFPSTSAYRPRLLVVGGTGVKKIYLPTRSGLDQPFGLNLGASGVPGFFAYDSTLDSGAGGFILFSLTNAWIVPEVIECPITSESGAVSTGAGKFTFRLPYAFMPTDARATLVTAQTSGSVVTVDINAGGGTIFETRLTIDNGEKTSTTAATPYEFLVPELPAPPIFPISDDTEITIDVDQIGDGTAKGLKVQIIGFQQ